MLAIDAHTHPIFNRRGRTPAEMDAWVARARRFGVRRMVALGDVLLYGRLPNARQIAAINDDTARLLRRHPDFFVGFCYVNPTLGERATVAEIERRAAAGFRGIKLEIANNARDACMRPVMRAAERLGLVVLQHSWDQSNIRQRSYHSDPEDTALLARRHPNVRVIMAHLTGIGWRGVRAARGLDNLVVDTSGGPPEAGLIEYAVELLGAEHVVYGSDLPIRDTPVTLARVLAARLDAAAERAVLHDNAARLLGL